MRPLYCNRRTGATWEVLPVDLRAPDDGGPITLESSNVEPMAERVESLRNPWRYGASVRTKPFVTLGEGGTPLIRGVWSNQPVRFKMESQQPTGSYKDRGVAVMISRLAMLGIRSIIAESSGNAGASVAAYAAASGIRCRVFVPDGLSEAKRVQILAYGAELIPVAGGRTRVSEAACAELAGDEACSFASHNWDPFFLEGIKTLAFELWEELGFAAPDAIILPLGQGVQLLGCYLGFLELSRSHGVRCPRLYGVQAELCAPFYHCWMKEEGKAIRPTIAEGIASPEPVRIREVLAAIEASGGGIVVASDDEILTAMRELARCGLFVEPTAAAAAAGATKLLESGCVNGDENKVIILTGSGLKAVASGLWP